MSLFAGIFGGGETKGKGLFDEGSAFSRSVANDQQEKDAEGKKLKAADGTPASVSKTGKRKEKKRKTQDAPERESSPALVHETLRESKSGKKKKSRTSDSAVVAPKSGDLMTVDSPIEPQGGLEASEGDEVSKAKAFAEQFKLNQGKKPEMLATKNTATVSESDGSDSDGDGGMGNRRRKKKLTKKQAEEKAKVDAENLTRTLFVGNVPVHPPAKLQRKIGALFAPVGEVEAVWVRGCPIKDGVKMPKRFAAGLPEGVNKSLTCICFVRFKEKDAVTKALALNMTVFEDHHLILDRAAAQSRTRQSSGGPETVYDPKKSIFLANLDPEVTDEQVIRLFNDGQAAPLCAGLVVGVRVVRDHRTRTAKGIGYVRFKTREAVKAALKLEGSKFLNRTLRVDRVKEQKTPRGAAGVAGVQGKRAGQHRPWEGVRTKGPNKIIKTTPGSQSAGGKKKWQK